MTDEEIRDQLTLAVRDFSRALEHLAESLIVRDPRDTLRVATVELLELTLDRLRAP